MLQLDSLIEFIEFGTVAQIDDARLGRVGPSVLPWLVFEDVVRTYFEIQLKITFRFEHINWGSFEVQV